jgi:hypothetical protein
VKPPLPGMADERNVPPKDKRAALAEYQIVDAIRGGCQIWSQGREYKFVSGGHLVGFVPKAVVEQMVKDGRLQITHEGFAVVE